MTERIETVFRGSRPDAKVFFGDIQRVKLVADLVEEHGRYA